MTPATTAPDAIDPTEPDPRRWITLGVLLATVLLVAMDTSVLNVSIPTMLRDLDTTVPSLEWVIAGYSLTFASLLIIGGRLGDVFGHRRLFVVGVALFGTGSLIAALTPNVGILIVGEALIEGIGASMMVPATLALLSITFTGRERAKAFAAWGAMAGAAVSFGPVVGGWLTTNWSWRWSFGINVVIAPIALVGALLFMPKGHRAGERTPIDLPGAALIASGMFLVVFALSQGPTYGWLTPREPLTVLGVTLWPESMPVSIIAVSFVAGIVVLAAFVRLERRKEARQAHPLFEVSQLRHRTFRYGLITSTIIALGQLGVLFALPLFLQGANGLTAEENGFWMLPFGVMIVIGAQIGGRMSSRYGPTNVVRTGLCVEVVGLAVLIPAVQPGVTFWQILPGLCLFGIGMGFASSQLTNLVLSEIAPSKSGVASGANSTSRQVGAALGTAIMGSLITVQTTNHAVAAVQGAGLPAAVTDTAVQGLEAMGPNWRPAAGVSSGQADTLKHVFDSALGTGARWTLGFSILVVSIGAVLSFLIPQVRQLGEELVVEPPTDGALLDTVPLEA